MQFFYWLIFLIAIGIAIFAVQNSNAPLILIKFLLWRFETSLIYTILGALLAWESLSVSSFGFPEPSSLQSDLKS